MQSLLNKEHIGCCGPFNLKLEHWVKILHVHTMITAQAAYV